MSAEGARKLFVGGISEAVTEQALRAVFERGGFNVTHLALPRDRESGRLRGFAFVTLSTEAEANAARTKLQGAECGGRPLNIREFSQEPPKRAPGAPGERPERTERPPKQELPTVFLGKLPFEANQGDIQRLFSEAGIGQITKLVLPLGPDGRPRGFGFASLESEDHVRLAVSKLNGATLMGRQIVVSPAQAKGSGGPPGGGGGPRPAWGGGEDGPRRSPGRFDRPPGEGENFEPTFSPELPIFAAHEGKGAMRRRDGKKEKRGEKKRGAGGDSVPRAPKGQRGGGGNWHRWEDDDD
jgi:nucleolin